MFKRQKKVRISLFIALLIAAIAWAGACRTSQKNTRPVMFIEVAHYTSGGGRTTWIPTQPNRAELFRFVSDSSLQIITGGDTLITDRISHLDSSFINFQIYNHGRRDTSIWSIRLTKNDTIEISKNCIEGCIKKFVKK